MHCASAARAREDGTVRTDLLWESEKHINAVFKNGGFVFQQPLSFAGHPFLKQTRTRLKDQHHCRMMTCTQKGVS